MPNNLSIIILTKDNQETLADTLESVKWADEIIMIDQGSTDTTQKIAQKYQANIFHSSDPSFAVRRNLGMKKATKAWLLYLDADETIPPTLRREIEKFISGGTIKNGEFIRDNYFLGTKMYPDYVQRLFHQTTLRGWQGDIHESPQYTGELSRFKHPLTHRTHRSISQMLEKTNEWSAVEAKLRFDAGHPPIKPWRVLRIAITEAWHQFVQKKVYRYGINGWIEGMFQVIDKMIVFVKLWELQQKASRT